MGGGAVASNEVPLLTIWCRCRCRWRYVLLCRNRADSVTWDLHKLMGVMLQCSAILVRQNVTSTCLWNGVYTEILRITLFLNQSAIWRLAMLSISNEHLWQSH